MSEWWTYRVRSFLLFSARTYERLVETYNTELWPLQPVVLAVALFVLLWLMRRHGAWRDRWVLAGLAAAWASVAWAFEHRRFAAINWAAEYTALVFAAQAVVLAWVAARGSVTLRREGVARAAALAIVAFGVLGYPWLTPALGRPWAQAEVFAFMPAPTAITTLGCLALATPLRPLLLIVPGGACLFEAALKWALHAGR